MATTGCRRFHVRQQCVCTAGPAVCLRAPRSRTCRRLRLRCFFFAFFCSLLFTFMCSYAADALCSAGTITPESFYCARDGKMSKLPTGTGRLRHTHTHIHTLAWLCPLITELGFWCFQCVNALQTCVSFPMLLLYPYAVHNVSPAWREHSQNLHQLVG